MGHALIILHYSVSGAEDPVVPRGATQSIGGDGAGALPRAAPGHAGFRPGIAGRIARPSSG
ncbi:MAG: hypothetical protein E6H04_08965 [Bacillati bacterium ANGP1]|uniref:Uncharacterized protein n=1 Tax=Candidatus Segetimicrobium genomatis TaxID=2569760 RepID=A0A537JAZ1_9BACT|nr:MAG: hypothetical protein E6H04_08965 [Terrabacteria group bacterium ANGP1]